MGWHTLHSINLLDVLGLCNSFLVAIVPDRDIGACFSQGMCYCEPDACSCSGDDGGAAFEREEREDAVCDGGHGVVVGELSVYYCAVHSGRRFRLRLDVKDWQDSRDVSVGKGHARVFMFLIQGASNVGVTTSRGPQ